MNWQRHKLGQKIVLILIAITLIGGLQSGPVSAAGSGYAASDVLGQLDGSGNPDFTASTFGFGQNQMYYPAGSTVDTVHHRLFVAQVGSNYRVTVYNLDSNNSLIDHTADYIIGQANFAADVYSVSQNGGGNAYSGLVYDSTTNRLFVSDNGAGRVLVYDLSNGITNGMNASYVLGQPDFVTATQKTTQDGMWWPAELALDPMNQRLFTADYQNNRVLVYDLSNGITNGMNASYVLGQPDFSSNSASTSQNGMSKPYGVAYNPLSKLLYVSESSNANRVTAFDLSNGITNGMNASYVLGQPDFTTNTPGVTQATLSSPTAVSVDTIRNVLYVDDYGNNRVMVYNLSGGITNGMNATMVLGQADFISNSSGVSQTNMNRPEGTIGLDPANNRIYVTDTSNNRLLIYNFAHITGSNGSAAAAGITSLSALPGEAFYLKLTASGVQGTATFALTGGALPPGLTLNTATGEITGTPTKTGSYTFEITTYDNLGAIGTYVEDPTFTINVAGTAAPGAPDTGYPKVSVLPAWQPVLILIGMLGIGLVARKIATR